MHPGKYILNERDVRRAQSVLGELDEALSSEASLKAVASGLPPEIVGKFRETLTTERRTIKEKITVYETTKAGDVSPLLDGLGDDLGLGLIVARIARGLTQKELARKLGVKEQQIQRYEADNYRTISLANYRRFANVLGVEWQFSLSKWSGTHQVDPFRNLGKAEARKIIKHARENGWFDGTLTPDSENEADLLAQYVTDHLSNNRPPALLRTGMVVEDQTHGCSMLAWKARIERRAEQIIDEHNLTYRPLDISWLPKLVRLSARPNGPAAAREFLLAQGIVLVAERQIPGMRVDGAAFLVTGIPVIGLTLRRDATDNFWFTLLHELAHVILHYRTGLIAGFFDDNNEEKIDKIEEEADYFAQNVLISQELWRRAPARISKSATVIEKFANDLGVHPAIVFGRVRMERNNYAAFTDKIGSGEVRRVLID